MEKGTLCFTDSEIEIIFSPRYPVSFIDVSDVYHRDADVTAVYEREKSSNLSAWSWIGVFEERPGVTSDPKAFAWSRDAKPIKDKVSSGTSDKFSVVFSKVSLKNFPIDERNFQFLFISCNDEVIGVSKAFRFRESADEPDLGLYDFPSFTLLYAEEEGGCNSACFQDSLDLLEDAMIEKLTDTENEDSDSADDDLELVLLTELEDGYETEQKIEIKQNRHQEKQKKQQLCAFKKTRRQHKFSGKFSKFSGKSTTAKIAMPKLDARKQKAKKRVCWEDHNTLMSFQEDHWNETLKLVNHSIVEKYLTNKERAVVPYVPVYNVSDNKNVEKVKKQQKSPLSLQHLANKELVHCTILLRPDRLPNKITEILGPIATVQCSNCAVMRSVLDVCRRQREIGSDQNHVLRAKITDLQKKADDLAEDVTFLQMRATFSENENEILRDAELKYDMSADDCLTLRKAVDVLQDQTKALCVEKNFISEKLKQTESYLASANQKFNISEKRLSEAIVALAAKTTPASLASKAGVSHRSKSGNSCSEKKRRRAERQSLIIKNQCAAVHELTEKLGEERQRTQEYRKQLNELAVKIEDWEKTVKEDAFEHERTKEELECSELVVMNLAKQLDTNEEMITAMAVAAEHREQGLLQTISYLRGLLEENGNTKTMKTFRNRMVASGQQLPSDMAWAIPSGQPLKTQEQPRTPAKKSPTTKEQEAAQEQETIAGATAQEHQANTSQASTTTKNKNKNKAEEEFTAVRIENETENTNEFQDGAERASIKHRTPGYKQKKGGKRNNHGKKQKVVDSRNVEEHKEMSCKGSRHKSLPEKCPECGTSFAGAKDSRVIDEHMAFHARYPA